MSDHTKIEWTDATWNPVRGCTKISARLRALLRRDVRRAVPRRAGPPLRAGLRPAARAREARRAASLDDAADGLRQLDERPVPQGRARRVHPARRARDGRRPTGTPIRCSPSARSGMARTASDEAARSRPSLPHIWWGVSVENRKHGLPRIDHLRSRAGRGAVPVGRAAAGGPGPAST